MTHALPGAVAAALDARVTQLAAPILAAPRTYDSLRAQQWFAQAPTSWDGILPPGDPATPAIRDQAKTEYMRRIAPSSDAALADARQQIKAAFERAAGFACQ